MKKGLIMEGGALRGMFTAGVTDVLMENNIHFDGAIGVSAGAVFGCNIKSGQIGRTIRYNINYCKDPRFCSLRSLIKTGSIFGTEFCYHRLPEELDVFDNEEYERNPMEFYSVSTDIVTGEPVYTRCDTLTPQTVDWLRASASMPVLSTIVEIDGKKLLDGGMSDPLPLKYFESIGYDRNVLILTQPGYRIKKETALSNLMKLLYRDYPKLSEIFLERHKNYNDTLNYIEEKERSGEVIIIRPTERLPIGQTEHNPRRIKETYEIGRRTAEEHLDRLKKFLA